MSQGDHVYYGQMSTFGISKVMHSNVMITDSLSDDSIPVDGLLLKTIYTVNHKKRWQYICDHNFGKSRSIFTIFALL